MMALVCLPAAAACATLAAAAFAVVRPVALDYAEPVVYGQALRIVWGQPLYQPIDTLPLTVAAYTPLYYWVGAALQVLVGPGFGPGRAVSLVCGVATAVLLGVLAGRRGGGVAVGALAAVLFLAQGFPRDRSDDAPWLGLYRVDLLGVCLSVAAIAVLTWRSSIRAVAFAGLCAGLALLCKPTFFAALIAGGLWMFLNRPRHAASLALFAGSAIVSFAIPCLLLQATSGAFVQNTVDANVNPWYAIVALGLLSVFVRTQWFALLLAGAYLWLGRPWRASHSRLLVLYWLASSLWLLGIGKIGSNHNYWIEFAAATAILAARGVASLLRIITPRFSAAGAAGLILALGVQLGGPPAVLESVRSVRSDVQSLLAASPDPEFNTLVERVRREPGGVLAEPMDVLVLGGRPVLFEPFIFSVRMDIGRWDPQPLIERICRGQIRLVVLGYSLEVGARLTDGLHALWPPPVMAALQKSVVLEGVQAQRYVYTPESGSAPGC